MKDRFNLLDTFVIVEDLQIFNSLRLNNIYDIDSKTYLLKFDDFEKKKKRFIIIKSGQFIYNIFNPPTERKRLPTSFCMKLRKHIKNKRCKELKVVKKDRAIIMIFGYGEHEYKLIIELFSYGNIILCNKNDIIMTLLRTHVYQNGNSILVGKSYPYDQLNDNYPDNNIEEELNMYKQNPCAYYNNKRILFDNSLNGPFNIAKSFTDALNKKIKIKTLKIINKKKIKLSPIENIRKHADQKIEKLIMNTIKYQDQIDWMIDNEEFTNRLLVDTIEVNKNNDFKFNEMIFNKNLNFYQNINRLYDNIKKTNEKIKRTEFGSENAISKLLKEEKKSKKVIKKEKIINDKWYHEYHWFYTSNKLLVICGKNSTQNEKIVKKHMNSNDLYLHSEVSGSGSGLILNTDNKKVHPIDLEEAGSFVICFSNSWKNKTPDYAYWVYPKQVSKTPESGEFVQKGSFIIRGKKNYIYRTVLELGCTILDKQFMIAPYKCIQKFDKNKIKIIPGCQKRKNSINNIIKKLKIDHNDYDIIDTMIPYGIKIVL